MASVRSGDRTAGLRIYSWRSLLASRSTTVNDLRSRADREPPVEHVPAAPVAAPEPIHELALELAAYPGAGSVPDSVTDPLVPGQRMPRYQATGWTALGSPVSLMVADGARLADAGSLSRRLLDRVDRTCSRLHPDADLARANQHAGRWVRVDPLLARVVQTAVRVARSTSGLIDPAARADPLARIDPATRAELAGTDLTAVAGPPLTGSWEQIEIDLDGGLKVPAGAELDLGAIGRAYAADSIAKTVSQETGTSLVVCIGSDIAVGNLPGDDVRWRMTLSEQPDDPQRYTPVNVVLTEGAVSTTSTLVRRWQQGGGRPRPHRDPRSGMPSTPVWRTASVCAATCVDASAGSAAAMMLGEQAPAWLWQRSLAARLVTPSGHVLRIAGWPVN